MFRVALLTIMDEFIIAEGLIYHPSFRALVGDGDNLCVLIELGECTFLTIGTHCVPADDGIWWL